jgi:predicted transcriptional regulator of viral defense system
MPAKRLATNASQILRLARRHGVIRPRDLAEHGIPRTALQRLVESGAIERRGRGLYIAAGADLGEKQTVIEASRRVPGGIVCLLSALQFHDFTTQTAREVWMALPAKAWRPRNPGLPLRFVFLSGPALESGIQEKSIHGVTVRVYSPAKTVADCFKFRNKVGMDVAMEALREGWRARRFQMHELTAAAKACRVWRIMRPYMELLVA